MHSEAREGCEEKSLQFEMAKRSIRIDDINRHELFASSVTEDGCDPRHDEMTLLLPMIGDVFMASFQQLITPPLEG